MQFNNDTYQVLTPNGWSDFDGIKKSTTDILFEISFTDNSKLKCTPSHLLKFPNGEFLEVCHIEIGDELFGNKTVSDISYYEGEFEVFDLTDVELANEYFTNGVVSHNCAFIKDIEEIWASSQMTLATGGGCVMLSTPNGAQGLFHREWQRAIEGSKTTELVRFHPINLPWYLHPDRDQTWRSQQDETLGKRLAAQECDCDFASSGHTVIDNEILQYYESQLSDPLERRGIGGDLWIFKYPDYNRKYVLCADVSRGDGEDFSAFHIIDVETVEQIAEFKGKIDTTAYGNLLVSIATEYNNALLVVDNRNIGYSTLQVIIDHGYKNLYYTYKTDPFLDKNIHLRKGYDLKDKKDMVPGYSIDVKTRPVMINKFEQYFSEKAPIIHSKRLHNEMVVFMWLDGKAQAARGYNDDLIMAFAIGLMVRDTSLKLLAIGVDLTKNTLRHTNRLIFRPNKPVDPYWEQTLGNGKKENLKWLL